MQEPINTGSTEAEVPGVFDLGTWINCFLPSLIGILIFLTPLNYQGETTIPLGLMSNLLRDGIGGYMGAVTTFFFVTGALLTLIFNLGPKPVKQSFPALFQLFQTTPVWLILRLMGGIFAVMTFLQLGPEWIIGKNTGVTAYVDVAGIIFCIIGLGCLLLPFLTDFGFLEFVGTLFRKFFHRIFNLPGRATIDTLASWVGSSSIAILVTARQYETGFYSAREAAVITTNFSVVSVPFVVLTAQVAGISDLFIELYGSMILIGVICALVTPRMPPLSHFKDVYYEPVGCQIREEVTQGRSQLSWALEQALTRASRAPGPIAVLKGGLRSAADIFLTMMPAAMTFEFIALVTYHHTPILQVMTLPLVPLLELLQIPEAAAASPGVIIGLMDQFVPAIIAGTIDNKITSFVLAGLSVTQLIFFAETVVLILRSKIPITVPQLLAIFCIRTAIALPILAVLAHYLV